METTTPEVLDREAERIIKDIGLPPCPAILTKLLQEMRSDDPDFNKLGNLIGGDVSLAAAMLKTVNSPFYGLRSKATSVKQAMVLLGLRNVAQLVTGLLLRDAFPGGSSDVMEEYWDASSAIAQINACLAGKFKGADRDEAYTFGLFRDCGILAMIGKYPDYHPILPTAKHRIEESVTAYEDKCYGMNHARIGYHLAKSWFLPEDICQAVLWHHEYAAIRDASSGVGGAAATHVALALVAEEIFVRSQSLGQSCQEWKLGQDFALSCLNITADEVDEVAAEIASEEAALA